MKKKAKSPKRNPADATTRNVRAANRRDELLRQWCKALKDELSRVFQRVELLEEQVRQIIRVTFLEVPVRRGKK